MSDTDLELLARYARHHAEDAFAELVHRHLGLVFSAALRQVRSQQLAEEVAQSVFTDLSRQADRLSPDTILTAWLYQITRRTAIDVVRREARRQLREQASQEFDAMNASTLSPQHLMPEDADWTHIEPLLDEAMAALEDSDRTAVLLRYFENKSLREVGQRLGTSEDTARKRVSRAVERMRNFFSKRGVSIGASGLVVVIAANAVQAAPTGIAATICATAALTGTTFATTATSTVTKTIIMTTLQKTLITAAFVATVGAGIHEARQASALRARVQVLQEQASPIATQIQQLTQDRDAATQRIASLSEELKRLNSNTGELLRLRSEAGRLRQQTNELGKLVRNWAVAKTPADPSEPTSFPRDSWANVGLATPEAAVQSYMWAKSNGDVKTAFASATPEMEKRVREMYFKDKSEEEISTLLIDSSKNQTGVQIQKKMVVADDQVIFQAHFDGWPDKTYSILTMKKIDGEWKVSNAEERADGQ
jgi:RNA polymerase sigma factor (sigma-70 family)